ncbi:MAG: DNA polymerase IV [Candidatus Krumholzibacteriales bacterium]
MKRDIVHVNTDDFYASVLRIRDPALSGRPVIVAGPSSRSTVQSASYEARAEGVARGMIVSRARRLCPGGEFVPPDWRLFRRVSRTVFSMLAGYTPLLEPVSLDEWFIDYTGCGRIFGSVLDAASGIKRAVNDQTGLNVSLGVASNKLVSHVASRKAKRSSLVDVSSGCERDFLAPVPIGRFPPVGFKSAPLLIELGISRVGDIAAFPEEVFLHCFGQWGRRLYRGALGEDPSPVRSAGPEREVIAAERELGSDSVDAALLEAVLYTLSERLAEKLSERRMAAGEISLEIGYTDGKTAVRKAASGPVSDQGEVFSRAEKLFSSLFTRRVRVRRLRLEGGKLAPEPRQLTLLEDRRLRTKLRKRRLYRTLSGLRKKFPPGVAPAFGKALPAVRGQRR